MRVLCALAVVIAIAGCNGDIASCGDEPDVSGGWTMQLAPAVLDGGVDTTIASGLSIDAELEQAGKTDVLGIGHYVYGTLSASDPAYFGALSIPRLLTNDGSKTGAVLGCTLRINVPIATPVSDDNVDQGPLRIALAGQITMKGVITGLPGSQLVMAGEPGAIPRGFAWTALRR